MQRFSKTHGSGIVLSEKGRHVAESRQLFARQTLFSEGALPKGESFTIKSSGAALGPVYLNISVTIYYFVFTIYMY